jgi:hypothetical protein
MWTGMEPCVSSVCPAYYSNQWITTYSRYNMIKIIGKKLIHKRNTNFLRVPKSVKPTTTKNLGAVFIVYE